MAGEAFMNQLPEEYKQGTVLSVDIGAGTTDLALFIINGIFYERSAKTIRLAVIQRESSLSTILLLNTTTNCLSERQKKLFQQTY